MECHCIIAHAVTDEQREALQGGIDYAASIGDEALPLLLARLGPCPRVPRSCHRSRAGEGM